MMCIICVEFNRLRDLADAHRMLDSARREPTAIPREHLEAVAAELESMTPETTRKLELGNP